MEVPLKTSHKPVSIVSGDQLWAPLNMCQEETFFFPLVLRLPFSTERYQGRQAELTRESYSKHSSSRSFLSLRTWNSPFPPRDTRVGTTCKKDTAISGLVWESVFGCVGLNFFSEKLPKETQRQVGRTGMRDPAIVSDTFWGRLCLCGLKTCLSHSETLGKLGWGHPRAVTPLPHQDSWQLG